MTKSNNPLSSHLSPAIDKPELDSIDCEDRPLYSSKYKLEDVQTTPQQLNQLDDAKVNDLKNNTDLRKKTAKYSAILAYSSLAVWALVVFANLAAGYRGVALLNDTKFIAVTTGATINVLAAFLVVVKGLFGNKNK